MFHGCRKHCAALFALGSGLGALCLFWALRGHPGAMAWWVAHVSMPFKRVVSALVDPLPFSACEAGATLAIAGALAMLGRCVWQAARYRQFVFGTWALHLAAVVTWGYALVCGLWGTQYYGPSFAMQAGLLAPAVSTEQLGAVTAYFAAQVNATSGAVPRAADGSFAVSVETILGSSTGTYDALAAQYPFLAGPERRAKPAFYSKLMSAAGFTGYLCPLLGESTLNVDCPAVFLPVTVTHEFAHQRGVAAEQEANFVGVQAAVSCADPVYNYSGWLFGYLHLSNALYAADPEAASASYASLCAAAHSDMAANDAYWKQWEGPAKAAGEKVYTTFLKSYDQDLGMKSYGACVDLLVEAYLPNTTAGATAAP